MHADASSSVGQIKGRRLSCREYKQVFQGSSLQRISHHGSCRHPAMSKRTKILMVIIVIDQFLVLPVEDMQMHNLDLNKQARSLKSCSLLAFWCFAGQNFHHRCLHRGAGGAGSRLGPQMPRHGSISAGRTGISTLGGLS